MISIEILQYHNTTIAFRNFDAIPGSLEANENDFSHNNHIIKLSLIYTVLTIFI